MGYYERFDRNCKHKHVDAPGYKGYAPAVHADAEVDETTRLKAVPELQEMDKLLFGARDLLTALAKCEALLRIAGPQRHGADTRPAMLLAAIEEITVSARREAITAADEAEAAPRRCEMLAAAGELLGLTNPDEWDKKFPSEAVESLTKVALESTRGLKARRKLRASVWVAKSVREVERDRWDWYDALLESLRDHPVATATTDEEAHVRFAAWRRMVIARIAAEIVRVRSLRGWERRKIWLFVALVLLAFVESVTTFGFLFVYNIAMTMRFIIFK